jgi:uncharacterized protein with NRDE domain
MCVIFFAYRVHPKYPLVLLANRDEFYDRPTAAARIWEDAPQILAGRDLVCGGTWLGVTETGRFSAVTNYRDPPPPHGSRSRGELVRDFLLSEKSPREFLDAVKRKALEYSGFNLLVGEIAPDSDEIAHYSNRAAEIRILEPGRIYGLSNHLLDTPWRKVEKGKRVLSEIIAGEKLSEDTLFDLLSDSDLADDRDLPDTGIGYEREKALSSIFIKTPDYGTRSSSVLLIDADKNITFKEKTFR